MLVHDVFIRFAENYYSDVAPQNVYGKVGLKMTFKQDLNYMKLSKKSYPRHQHHKSQKSLRVYIGA